MSFTGSKQKLFFVPLEKDLACCAMGEIRFDGERWRAICYQDGERYEAPTPGPAARGEVKFWLSQKWVHRTSDELHWLADEFPGMGAADQKRLKEKEPPFVTCPERVKQRNHKGRHGKCYDWIEKSGKYRVRVYFEGRSYFGGNFKTEEEAAARVVELKAELSAGERRAA